jgi:hypothetical protein
MKMFYTANWDKIISLCNHFNPLKTVSESESESESYVTTDGQSASLSWCQAPIWGLRPDFYDCQTVAGLLMWGALSDERTDLSCIITAGSRQRNHSGPSPVELATIFYCLRLRLPFPSPPTTRRVTVKVFDPAASLIVLVITCWHGPHRKHRSSLLFNCCSLGLCYLAETLFRCLFLRLLPSNGILHAIISNLYMTPSGENLSSSFGRNGFLATGSDIITKHDWNSILAQKLLRLVYHRSNNLGMK